jgi:hypothetical protein
LCPVKVDVPADRSVRRGAFQVWLASYAVSIFPALSFPAMDYRPNQLF